MLGDVSQELLCSIDAPIEDSWALLANKHIFYVNYFPACESGLVPNDHESAAPRGFITLQPNMQLRVTGDKDIEVALNCPAFVAAFKLQVKKIAPSIGFDPACTNFVQEIVIDIGTEKKRPPCEAGSLETFVEHLGPKFGAVMFSDDLADHRLGL